MPEVGQWGPEPFLDRRGRGLTNLTVTVYETDGTTLAVLYTDQTGTTVLANPLPIGVATTAAGLDVRGNVSFYAEPGAYELAADHDGSEVYRSPITVSVDTDTSGGAVDSVNGLVGIVVLDASDIPFIPGGTVAATDVQAAIDEVALEAGAGGAPTTADYLTGTSQAGLSAEIVVGPTPGGELGGTWGTPTVDAVHSGSSHAATQAAAEAAAATYADTKVSLTGPEVVAGVKTFFSDPLIPDEAYGAGWNGSLEPPTKNAVYDQIESVVAGTPALHAATHADGGTDEVALDASQIVSGILANARLDPDLAAIAALTTTAYGRSVLETANAAALRTLAELVIGTDVQAFSSVLAATTASFLVADETKLDGIEALADVTDATNVNAAGAVMETDYDAFTVLAADTDNTPLPLTMGASTLLARLAAGGIVAATPTQGRTLLGLGTAALAALIDDDTFATALPTNIASAESTKTYVDDSITGLDELADGDGTVVDTSTPGFVKTHIRSTINTQTVDYTLALGDAGDMIAVNSATAKNVTFPQNSDVAIPIGARGSIYQQGAGAVTPVAGTGATIIGTGLVGALTAGDRIAWEKVATNTFVVESVSGAVFSGLIGHVIAADPHTQYALESALLAGTTPVMLDLAQMIAFGG